MVCPQVLSTSNVSHPPPTPLWLRLFLLEVDRECLQSMERLFRDYARLAACHRVTDSHRWWMASYSGGWHRDVADGWDRVADQWKEPIHRRVWLSSVSWSLLRLLWLLAKLRCQQLDWGPTSRLRASVSINNNIRSRIIHNYYIHTAETLPTVVTRLLGGGGRGRIRTIATK